MTILENIRKAAQEISPEEHRKRVAIIRAIAHKVYIGCWVITLCMTAVGGFYAGHIIADTAISSYNQN